MSDNRKWYKFEFHSLVPFEVMEKIEKIVREADGAFDDVTITPMREIGDEKSTKCNCCEGIEHCVCDHTQVTGGPDKNIKELKKEARRFSRLDPDLRIKIDWLINEAIITERDRCIDAIKKGEEL